MIGYPIYVATHSFQKTVSCAGLAAADQRPLAARAVLRGIALNTASRLMQSTSKALMRRFQAILSALILAMAGPAVMAATVSVEGELAHHGMPAMGLYDLRFTPYAGPEGQAAQRLGPSMEMPGMVVEDGRFSVDLDLPGTPQHGREIWLQVDVAPAEGGAAYVSLEPLISVEIPQAKGADNAVPPGAIAFFEQADCPAGWTEYEPARGRAVLGLNPGGTVAGIVGTPLSDLEIRPHDHSVDAETTSTALDGQHNHAWGQILAVSDGVQWISYTASGLSRLVFPWENGVGNEGSGIYPLAAQPNDEFYTTQNGLHQHGLTIPAQQTGSGGGVLPYVQLLTCRKS